MLNRELAFLRMVGHRGFELPGGLPDRGGIRFYPTTKNSSGFWKENLTFNARALACCMLVGPALAPVTLVDQRGNGGLGCGVWCVSSSICKVVTVRQPC